MIINAIYDIEVLALSKYYFMKTLSMEVSL
jgi:hypothetical protein